MIKTDNWIKNIETLKNYLKKENILVANKHMKR